jgi:GNAT superfamily N-acetyltransferase
MLLRVGVTTSKAAPARSVASAPPKPAHRAKGPSTSIDLIKALYRERPHAALYTPFCKIRDVLAECSYLVSTDGQRLSAAVAYTQDSIEFAWALPGRAETLRNLIVQARHRLRQVSFVAVVETGSRSWSQVLGLPMLGRYYRSYLPTVEAPLVELPEGYRFLPLDATADAEQAAGILNHAYPSLRHLTSAARIQKLAARPYYRPDLWFFLQQVSTGALVGLALGGFCEELAEGFIDWVEVIPRHRGHGLGRLLILEAIRRLSPEAEFITGSGSLDAPFVVGDLYERCGFSQTRQWTVLGEGRRKEHHLEALFVPPSGPRSPMI